MLFLLHVNDKVIEQLGLTKSKLIEQQLVFTNYLIVHIRSVLKSIKRGELNSKQWNARFFGERYMQLHTARAHLPGSTRPATHFRS